MKLNKNQKAYAFIDSQNLNLGVRSQGWILDFNRFRVYLKDKYHAEKAFLFIGYMAGNQSLYTSLQKAGYILIFKPVLEVSERSKTKTIIKGNVDAELVLHTMIEYPNYDKAIVVSGDGDFHCLIEYLESKEKLGRVIIPNRKAFSSLLWKFHQHLDFMDNLKEKLGRKDK